MPQAVMLFGAGFGTRMGALTADRPKPLIKVAGHTLLGHALTLIDEAQVPKVVVNAHYKADQIVTHLRDTPIYVSVEHPDILDTGGGLKHALPHLGEEPLFTMNSDAMWDGPNPLTLLAKAWKPKMSALMLCVPMDRAIGRKTKGDIDLTADGIATWGGNYVYTGVQIIRPELVSAHPQTVFSLRAIWDKLERKSQLHGITYTGRWCDVGHPEGIALAENMVNYTRV